jgi:hypothetical protein
VVPALPLRLLSRSAVRSSAETEMPAGQPSMVTPIAGPCDSPKSDTLKTLPNVFII